MPRNRPPNFFGSRIAARCVTLGGLMAPLRTGGRINFRPAGCNGKAEDLADDGPLPASLPSDEAGIVQPTWSKVGGKLKLKRTPLPTG